MGAIRRCCAVQVGPGCVLICTHRGEPQATSLSVKTCSIHNADTQHISKLFAAILRAHDIHIHTHNIGKYAVGGTQAITRARVGHVPADRIFSLHMPSPIRLNLHIPFSSLQSFVAVADAAPATPKASSFDCSPPHGGGTSSVKNQSDAVARR